MNKLVPAGHARTVASKAHISEPVSELEKTFLEFRKHTEGRICYGFNINGYRVAEGLLRKINVCNDELHSLFLKYGEAPNCGWDGPFLSTGHALCPENVIVMDIPFPIGYIGQHLPPEKLLVNTGKTGKSLGMLSEGVIVNCGHAGRFFGFDTRGTVVNAGASQERFGDCHTGGIAIALQKPESYGVLNAGTRIRHDKIPALLKEYTEELAELCREPADRIYARYGKAPAHTIRKDIEDILRTDHE